MKNILMNTVGQFCLFSRIILNFCFANFLRISSFFYLSCDEEDKFLPFLRVFTPRPNNIVIAGKKIYFPQSPCPSPTPAFQQLYMALAHIERLTQESPENLTSTIFNDFTEKRRSSMSSTTLAKNDNNERTNMRRQSYPLSLKSSKHGKGTT